MITSIKRLLFICYMLIVVTLTVSFSYATPGGYGAPKGLTSGCDGCLDNIDGTNLEDGDLAFASNGSVIFFYILDEDSALTESSPDVIKPDSNAGDKRWILLQPAPVDLGGI